MSPQLMPTNGGGISAVTSPATAPAAPATLTTSDARNDMHPPDALPDAGNDAHEFSLSGRDGTAVSKEGVFNVRGDNDGRSSVPLTGVSDVGVEGTMGNEGDSDPTPPMGLIQLNPPLLTEADSETSTAAFNTTKASNFTQQPASSIQLLVSCEEGSVAADVSVSHALQQQNGLSNTNAAALDPESSLQMKEMPKEHQWKPLHTPLHVTVTFDVDERGQSSTSDGAPTPAAMDLSSLLSIVSILSSPELSPSLQFERAPRRVAVSSAGEVEPTPLLGPELNRPGAAKEEKIDNLVSVRSPGLVWGLVGGSSAANCDDLSETAPAAPSTNSSQAARPHSEFPGGRVASADTTEAFFSALRLPNLPKWRRWVSSKYQEVVRQLSGFTNGKWFPQLRPSDLPPKRRGLLKTKSNGGSSSRSVSFPPGDATETVESRSAALGDTHTLKGKIPSLTMALSFSPSRLRSGDEGERSRHFRDYEAPGGLANWRSCGPNNSWFSVVGSTEQRGVVGATGRPMQLRCCITASSSSFIARDAPFPRSSEEWRGDSLTPLSFSLLGESRAGSSGTPEVSRASGGSLQRLFGGLDSTMNNSSNYMNHSGDYYSMSLASLPGHHSLMSRSPANAIADDNYRHMLYHLFHHPPSSRIGDLTACYEAYKAMADTSSNGHHLFNWGELSLLLQPEDYIDYCALFPSHHFITFRDFVELVEVMSVRYHR
ncbi:hypothetical protein JKF63_00406 [Porcisia hertigi]|uniref:Uncharacterized protein n=1 Tax=Porcisia hertigi TaxID=2761500 RepID=A0A836I4W9_9TRYP|nr:hypothetical protein JKF63_00406 [Porcisia hertigi]